MTDLLQVVRAAGATASEIPCKEGRALLQAWREVYCAPVRKATGKWVIGGAAGYSWHTFSYEYFPCLEGSQALAEYTAQHGREFVVMTERSDDTALCCTGPVLPDFSGLFCDVYVAPASLDWTMVFTHEHDSFGPYFSRARWALHGMSRD